MDKQKAINFEYKLSGQGWSEGILSIDGQSLAFEISYLCEPIVELLEGLIEINQNFVLINDGKHFGKYSMKWDGEPWGYKWQLEALNDRDVKISVEEFKDLDDVKTGQVKIDMVCNIDAFTLEVVRALDAFIKSIGLLDYERQWGYGFPLTNFLKLKKYLIDKGLWENSEKGSDQLISEFEILLK